MPRNRTIYNSQALYVSAVSATGMQIEKGSIQQLSRIQSFDEDFTRNFTDVNQYGNLAAIDRIEVENPDVTASFSYYVTNGENEKKIGLNVYQQGTNFSDLRSCISGLLTKQTDEKNYYLLITEEGNDAAGYVGSKSGVIGIGNGFLTSYSVNAAVGEIPTADVEIEGLNIRIYGNLKSNNFEFGKKIISDKAGLLFGFSSIMNKEGTLLAIGGTANPSVGGDGTGIVSIFTGSQTLGWGLKQKLSGDTTNRYNDLFGQTIATNDNITLLSIGGTTDTAGGTNAGAIWIYTGSATDNWVLKQKLSGDSAGDFFGATSSFNKEGTLLAVGGYGDTAGGTDAGAVWIYTGSATDNWVLKQKLSGDSSGDFFGASSSFNKEGTLLAVGGYGDTNGAGAVWIYTGNATSNWAQIQKISGDIGSKSLGRRCVFNEDGTFLIVGGRDNNLNSGSAWIYTGNPTNLWTLKQKLNGDGGIDWFGSSIDINNNATILTIGGLEDTDGGLSAGAVWIYTGNATSNWALKQKLSGDSAGDRFGASVNISENGKFLVIGGTTDADVGTNAGAVWTYNLETNIIPAVSRIDGSNFDDKYFQLPFATSLTENNIPTALQPGDIIFSIPTSGTLGYLETDLKVQDFTLSFDLSRTPLQKLGNRFAFSREIDFPVTATLEVNAEVGDLNNGNLSNILCGEKEKDFTILMKKAGCGTNKDTALAYVFKGAKLTSQSFSSAIGDNATMNATYEVQLGGPQDVSKGIFISGLFQNFNAVLVSGAGTSTSNGIYKYVRMLNGYPSYELITNDASYIAYDSINQRWVSFNEDVGIVYASSSPNNSFYPWETMFSNEEQGADGDDPNPILIPINI